MAAPIYIVFNLQPTYAFKLHMLLGHTKNAIGLVEAATDAVLKMATQAARQRNARNWCIQPGQKGSKQALRLVRPALATFTVCRVHWLWGIVLPGFLLSIVQRAIAQS